MVGIMVLHYVSIGAERDSEIDSPGNNLVIKRASSFPYLLRNNQMCNGIYFAKS